MLFDLEKWLADALIILNNRNPTCAQKSGSPDEDDALSESAQQFIASTPYDQARCIKIRAVFRRRNYREAMEPSFPLRGYQVDILWRDRAAKTDHHLCRGIWIYYDLCVVRCWLEHFQYCTNTRAYLCSTLYDRFGPGRNHLRREPSAELAKYCFLGASQAQTAILINHRECVCNRRLEGGVSLRTAVQRHSGVSTSHETILLLAAPSTTLLRGMRRHCWKAWENGRSRSPLERISHCVSENDWRAWHPNAFTSRRYVFRWWKG